MPKITCKFCRHVENSVQEWKAWECRNECKQKDCVHMKQPEKRVEERKPSSKSDRLKLTFHKSIGDVLSELVHASDTILQMPVARPITTQIIPSWGPRR